MEWTLNTDQLIALVFLSGFGGVILYVSIKVLLKSFDAVFCKPKSGRYKAYKSPTRIKTN